MSIFTPETIEELRKPLDISNVRTRNQAGRVLSYIEGWHAIDEANSIFGFDNWSRETIYCKEVSRVNTTISEKKKPGFKVGYEAKVRITVNGVIREGTGHGSGSMSDLFDAIESAAKESETDAMKRALMQFGYRFGLALYDKTQANVEDGAQKEREEAIRKNKEEIKSLEESLYIPIPMTADNKSGDWIEYTDLLLRSINLLKTQVAFHAFSAANMENLDILKNNDPELRKQISDCASRQWEAMKAAKVMPKKEVHHVDGR